MVRSDRRRGRAGAATSAAGGSLATAGAIESRDLDRRLPLRAALVLLAALAGAGCARFPPGVSGVSGASPAPETPWTPPRNLAAQPPPSVPREPLPNDLLERAREWTLADLVDIALRTSSETRAAWQDARAAAAAHGSEKGSRWPRIDVGADLRRERTDPSEGEAVETRTYGYSADLGYLLFDFGGRGASIEETRQALFAADWMHDQAIQDVVFDVERAYFGYVAAAALLEAELSSLEEARVNRDAAEERRSAGLATIADVLQAETAFSEARLAVDMLQGSLLATRGALATAAGLPADTDFDVELPSEELPVDRVSESVEEYLDRARAERPELAAARARALEARARLRKVRAEGYPSLSLSGGAERTHADDPDVYDDSYRAALLLRFPLFTGFAHRYDVHEARAEAEAALERLAGAERAVELEVWIGYNDFKTAERRVRTSDDLMRSATESHLVAQGRYKSGVGSVLDLLAAQSALENARAERVRARSDWFVSLARLAHATGGLRPGAPAGGSAREGEEGP